MGLFKKAPSGPLFRQSHAKMDNSLILAIDQGTNSTRAILFDFKGNVVFQSSKEVSLNRIDSHKVEQDPREILESARFVVHNAFASVPESSKISCIGIATQRSSLLAMDKKGLPLSPVLSWQDRRAEKEIACYGNSEQMIKKLTGLPLSAHYGATKFRWLLDNNEDVKKAFANDDLIFAPLVTYLLYNLLDNKPLSSDQANSHRTLLMNLNTGLWDEQLLNLFGINLKNLPQCLPVCYDYGHINGIPVTAVSGDQNAAVFSEGGIPLDSVFINAGTGAFILKPVGPNLVYHNQLLSGLTESNSESISYTLEGTVNGAASAISWAKEKFAIIGPLDLNKILVKVAEPNMFVNTIGGLGSPFWKNGPEPGWLNGLSSVESALAGVIESIVFLLKINLDEMAGKSDIDEIYLSGGVSRIDYFCRNLANFTGIKVSRLSMSEATARGIAFLAAGKPSEWSKGAIDIFYPEPLDTLSISRFRKFREFIDQI
jgi:glycerol kinase